MDTPAEQSQNARETAGIVNESDCRQAIQSCGEIDMATDKEASKRKCCECVSHPKSEGS